MADNNPTTTTDSSVEETGAVRAQTRLTDLRKNEKYWMAKAILRAIICVLNIIAIGCAGKIIARQLDLAPTPLEMNYSYFPGASVGALIAICISLVWCLLSLFIPFVLKPVRPIHPGVAVGLDLCLWIVFVFVGLLSISGVIEILNFGADPTYLPDGYGSHYSDGSYYDGSYYLAPNNTWVYNVSNVNSGYDGYITPDIVRDCTPQYTSCAEQDAAVNELWRQKPTLEAVEIMLSAILWLDVLLHFTLFVWACVDTNTRNLGRRARQEKIVADKIIRGLEEKGLVMVRDGQVVAPESQPQSRGAIQPANELPEASTTRS